MIKITLGGTDLWDEEHERFIESPEPVTLKLEHSLISISKWEMEYEKPFLTDDQKTKEEFIYYIKCMTINSGVPDNIYKFITNSDIEKINKYNNRKMTATWFSNQKEGTHSGRIPTSELIYAMMILNNVPFECQTWHINRLLTLLRVIENEQSPKKKMSQKEVLSRYDAINRMNRAKYKSKG